MMSRVGCPLIALLALLLTIAVLLYLRYGLRRQVASLEEELETVQRERNGIAAEVDHLKDRLKRYMWKKEECMEQKKTLSNQLHNIQEAIKDISSQLLSAQRSQQATSETLAAKEKELAELVRINNQCQASIVEMRKSSKSS